MSESASTRLDSLRAPERLCEERPREDDDEDERLRPDEELFEALLDLPFLLLDRELRCAILARSPPISPANGLPGTGGSNTDGRGTRGDTVGANGAAGMEAKEEGNKMAQTTRSSSSRSTRSRSSSNRSTSRNGSSKSSRTRSSGSSRSGNGTSRAKQAQRRTTTNGPVAKTGEKVAELASKATKAAPQTETVRRTGKKVGNLASKAKTPLVAGGAALAGIAGGVALKSRTKNRRPVGKLKTRRLPSSLRNIDLGKVDLDAITDAAKRIRSLGEQVGDVADAADKTRKKHN